MTKTDTIVELIEILIAEENNKLRKSGLNTIAYQTSLKTKLEGLLCEIKGEQND